MLRQLSGSAKPWVGQLVTLGINDMKLDRKLDFTQVGGRACFRQVSRWRCMIDSYVIRLLRGRSNGSPLPLPSIRAGD